MILRILSIIIFFIAVYVLAYFSYREFIAIDWNGTEGFMRSAIAILTFKFSTLYIIIYASLVTSFGYFLSRIVSFKKIIFGTFICGLVLLGIFVLLFSFGIYKALIAGAIGVLIFVVNKRLLLHNLIVLISMAGIALSFALVLSPFQAMIFFTLMAIFDSFAVYISGHNFILVRAMIKAGNFNGLIIPFSSKNINAEISSAVKNSPYFALSSVDLILPAIFALSLLQISTIHANIAFIGAMIGVIVGLCVSERQKNKNPISLLSFACFGALLIYSIYILI